MISSQLADIARSEQLAAGDLGPLPAATDLGKVTQYAGSAAISAAAAAESAKDLAVMPEALPLQEDFVAPVENKHYAPDDDFRVARDFDQGRHAARPEHDDSGPTPGDAGGRPPIKPPADGPGTAGSEEPNEQPDDDSFSWLSPPTVKPVTGTRYIGTARVPGSEQPVTRETPEVAPREAEAAAPPKETRAEEPPTSAELTEAEAIRARYAGLGAVIKQVRESTEPAPQERVELQDASGRPIIQIETQGGDSSEISQATEASRPDQDPDYQARLEAERNYWQTNLDRYTAYKAELLNQPNTPELRMNLEAIDRSIALAQAAIADPESVMPKDENAPEIDNNTLEDILRKMREL